MLERNFHSGLSVPPEEVRIGPLNILRLQEAEALDMVRAAVLSQKPLDIAICNAHTILTALDTPDYAATLGAMTLLNDGVGVNLASQVLNGKSFPDNLNGTDFVPLLLENAGLPLRIYLFGAGEAQVQATKGCIEVLYPDHLIVGARNGYFDPAKIEEICAEIQAAEPDLLLVGMGNPRQEQFIVENRHRLSAVTVAIGVGALFDFMSGSVVRAPRPVRALGMEWLFRLLQEPRRLSKRYFVGIPRFLYQIAKLKWADRRRGSVNSDR